MSDTQEDEGVVSINGVRFLIEVVTEAEVEHHAECPACGRENCETNHMAGDVT